ncbi:hypothetical protein KIN20_005969 [Parelaphostrongylus tenuis]|uniref:Uncharacterized protein n=1 Tax=Parelaphostrongylus tenuis TaxID=148309 RepID=A0AAD5QJ09_PARTN|nr:hypothetical protein KIN20_005969 [Parelaphostrongylus tenuis]
MMTLLSLFNAEEMSDHKFHFQSTSSSECLDSGADYAEICMRSKLTEIGLRYVNKVYKMLRDMNAKVTESRTKTSQCTGNLRAVELQISQVHEELGDAAPYTC